jgi:hypothetical protein
MSKNTGNTINQSNTKEGRATAFQQPKPLSVLLQYAEGSAILLPVPHAEIPIQHQSFLTNIYLRYYSMISEPVITLKYVNIVL